MGSRREQLICHPAERPTAVQSLSARIGQLAVAPDRRILDIAFELTGDTDRIRPGRHRPIRGISRKPTDGLWQSTCFEIFYRSPDCPAYHEFNGALTGHWAHYGFADYRTGQARMDRPPDRMWMDKAATGFTFTILLPVVAERDEALMIGLSAVIEDTGGNVSHWALRHPAAQPDFHHDDCFAVMLDAPNAP